MVLTNDDISSIKINTNLSNPQIEFTMTESGYIRFYNTYITERYLLFKGTKDVIFHMANRKDAQLYKNVSFGIMNKDKRHFGFRFKESDFELIKFSNTLNHKHKFIDLLRK